MAAREGGGQRGTGGNEEGRGGGERVMRREGVMGWRGKERGPMRRGRGRLAMSPQIALASDRPTPMFSRRLGRFAAMAHRSEGNASASGQGTDERRGRKTDRERPH